MPGLPLKKPVRGWQGFFLPCLYCHSHFAFVRWISHTEANSSSIRQGRKGLLRGSMSIQRERGGRELAINRCGIALLSGTWADTSVISHGYGFYFSAEFDIFSNVNSVLNDFHGVDERFLSPSRRIRRLCLRIRLSCLVALDVFVPPRVF